MSQPVTQHKIEKLDPVWSQIRVDAEHIIQKDPALGSYIYSTILSFDSFEDALMHRLAKLLSGTDIGFDLVVQAFQDAMKLEPEIGHAARADILATFDRDPACHRYIDPLLYFKGYNAIQIHRITHRLWHMGRNDLAYFLQSRLSIMSAIDIHPAVRIGKGIMVDHGHDIVIGETCIIEDNVSIMQGVTLGGTGKETGDRHPKIRNGVLIGAGAKVLGNIEIGRGSRVAACSVVLHDVPPESTVAGIPAKVVGNAGHKQPSLTMDQTLDYNI